MIQINDSKIQTALEHSILGAVTEYLSTPEGKQEAARTIIASAGKTLVERSLGAQHDIVQTVRAELIKELLLSQEMQEIKASILAELKQGGLDRVLMPLLLEHFSH